jgi:hypothetical protein
MQFFIIETLLCRGWRRGGEIFWTLEEAVKFGRLILRRKTARGVRILPATCSLSPVLELPEPPAQSVAKEGGAQ